VYDYAITFDDEITFLRDSKWSIVKILYLVCRYLMFPFVITNTFVAGATVIFCAERKKTTSPLTPSAKSHSAVMFLVRAYALWHQSRAALIIIIVNFTV
ncbi:hypothetical protein PAXINDRAFT_59707, partial [Paxillus involutus ATCC 200175]